MFISDIHYMEVRIWHLRKSEPLTEQKKAQ